MSTTRERARWFASRIRWARSRPAEIRVPLLNECVHGFVGERGAAPGPGCSGIVK